MCDSIEASPSAGCSSDSTPPVMKRAAAKQLIERYYYQLTEGCGRPDCSNDNCASSSAFKHLQLNPNRTAILAVQLLKEKAQLCDLSKPSKVARSSEDDDDDEEHEGRASPADQAGASSSFCPTAATSSSAATLGSSTSARTSPLQSLFLSKSDSGQVATTSKSEPISDEVAELCIDENKLHEIIEQCDGEKNWSRLVRKIGGVFGSPEALMNSFLVQENSAQKMDVDGSNFTTVDLQSLRRSYKELFSLEHKLFENSLINAIGYLSSIIQMDLRYHKLYESKANFLNIFLIIFEIPLLDSPEFLESATPAVCKAAAQLPVSSQAQLARIWSQYEVVHQRRLLDCLQQMITVRIVYEDTGGRNVNLVNDETITGACSVLKILYYASILAGVMDSVEVLEAEANMNTEVEGNLFELLHSADETKEKSPPKLDPLGQKLGVNPLDCRSPSIPFADFVNEALCDQIERNRTIAYFKAEGENKFTFLQHPFLLTPAVKNLALYYDNRSRMISERRFSLFQSFVHGAPTMPYLRLRVRRDHIIEDALVELEVVAMDRPGDFKKQLFVEFDGEQGIDEGGVSKEFFQLVVEEIFNPDIGMFTYDEETHTCWFNPTSFENDGQFTLIGIVLGLAIYNNIILDVHFPMVVYRKLMGKMGRVEDLPDSHPTLARSLQQLLDYEGDVEDAFMMNFRIGYHDVFGNSVVHDLKEKGNTTPVTNDNRKEFVLLYAHWLLNKSVEKQFRAFQRGFQMVTEESPLKFIFFPEEVELLVCGSRELDFEALERAAEYDGGFTADSTTVKHFWEVVHEMTSEQQSKLLQFTTGSDRAPIGGLGKLKLIIARNGVDSERLPTAHTCFNVLLLPDYLNKEQLSERLLKAITYAKGFGMI